MEYGKVAVGSANSVMVIDCADAMLKEKINTAPRVDHKLIGRFFTSRTVTTFCSGSGNSPEADMILPPTSLPRETTLYYN